MGYSIFFLCALISKVFSNYSIAVILRCWSPFLQGVLLSFLGLFFVCPCILQQLFSLQKIKTFNIHFLFSVRRNYKPRHKNEKRLFGQLVVISLVNKIACYLFIRVYIRAETKSYEIIPVQVLKKFIYIAIIKELLVKGTPMRRQILT